MEGRNPGTERSRSSQHETDANPAFGEHPPGLCLWDDKQNPGYSPLKKMYAYIPKKGATGEMISNDHFAMRQEMAGIGGYMADYIFNGIVLSSLIHTRRFDVFTRMWPLMTKREDQSSDYLRESLIHHDTHVRNKKEQDLMVRQYQNQKIKCGKGEHANCRTKQGK